MQCCENSWKEKNYLNFINIGRGGAGGRPVHVKLNINLKCPIIFAPDCLYWFFPIKFLYFALLLCIRKKKPIFSQQGKPCIQMT